MSNKTERNFAWGPWFRINESIQSSSFLQRCWYLTRWRNSLGIFRRVSSYSIIFTCVFRSPPHNFRNERGTNCGASCEIENALSLMKSIRGTSFQDYFRWHLNYLETKLARTRLYFQLWSFSFDEWSVSAFLKSAINEPNLSLSLRIPYQLRVLFDWCSFEKSFKCLPQTKSFGKNEEWIFLIFPNFIVNLS